MGQESDDELESIAKIEAEAGKSITFNLIKFSILKINHPIKYENGSF